MERIAYYRLGELYSHIIELESKYNAEACFKAAIDINPKYEDAYLALGKLYMSINKYTNIEELFLKVIEINPNNQYGYYNLGLLYLIRGMNDQLERICLKTIELELEDENTYIMLISSLEDLRRTKEADKIYDSIVFSRLNFDISYNELGYLLNNLEETNKAEKIWLKAQKLFPKKSNILFSLGEFYFNQGRYDKSEKYYRKLMKFTQENYKFFIGNRLFNMLCYKGKSQEAEKYKKNMY